MKIVYIIVLFLQIGGILTQQNYGQVLDKFCLKNAGARAVANLHIGVTQFQECMNATMIEWTAEIQKTGKVEAGFELVCSKIHNLKNCMKRLAYSFEDCVRSDQKETIDFGLKAATAGLDFVCDNIDDIKKAMSSDDSRCVSTKEHAFEQCVQRYNSSHNHNQHHEADPFAAYEALKVSYDAKGCSDLLGFERCTVNALAECRDPLFSRLLDTMWKYTNSVLPCDNLPKSKASTTGVVSVLLLISAAFNMYL